MATLPLLIDLLERLRRALNKSGRHMHMLADAFVEARHRWRDSKSLYTE